MSGPYARERQPDRRRLTDQAGVPDSDLRGVEVEIPFGRLGAALEFRPAVDEKAGAAPIPEAVAEREVDGTLHADADG